ARFRPEDRLRRPREGVEIRRG
ncbi:MAG: hypothetical protein AVDCRST_MAG12-3133, partial [uncultured Rubrobacteraceae bacterium]